MEGLNERHSPHSIVQLSGEAILTVTDARTAACKIALSLGDNPHYSFKVCLHTNSFYAFVLLKINIARRILRLIGNFSKRVACWLPAVADRSLSTQFFLC